MKRCEDDLVFCTVKKIDGTVIFLDIYGGGEGSMVLSEVSAGRIRNLREYISVNKKIVCKILRISGNHIELSFRRVTAKERDSVFEKHKKMKILSNVLKIIGEKPEEIIEKINSKYDFMDFFENACENVDVLEEFLSKENALKIFKILAEKESSEKIVNRFFKLMSLEGDGLYIVKKILNLDYEINYLGSSKFRLSVSGKDFKEANFKIEKIIKEIEESAKKEGAKFLVVEK